MQRQRQFDYAEVRTQMPAVLCQLGDQLLADFFGQRRQLLDGEVLQLSGAIHHVQISAFRIVHWRWERRRSA